MIKGLIQSQIVPCEHIYVSNRSSEALERLQAQYTIHATHDNTEVVRHSDIVILSVKPNVYQEVILQIKEAIHENHLIVSIAPSFSLEQLQTMLGTSCKVVRAMPNTPAKVGQGMTAFVCDEHCTKEDVERVSTIFSSFGQCAQVKESLMPAVVAVSGSSPAYIYMFIEALADGAVREGMPRAMAYQFAAQAVLGSAQMVLDTNEHPGVLKDQVCSPAGTTIEAVAALERANFRSSILEAMAACTSKMGDK